MRSKNVAEVMSTRGSYTFEPIKFYLQILSPNTQIYRTQLVLEGSLHVRRGSLGFPRSYRIWCPSYAATFRTHLIYSPNY